jgi:hypothetical protein
MYLRMQDFESSAPALSSDRSTNSAIWAKPVRFAILQHSMNDKNIFITFLKQKFCLQLF